MTSAADAVADRPAAATASPAPFAAAEAAAAARDWPRAIQLAGAAIEAAGVDARPEWFARLADWLGKGGWPAPAAGLVEGLRERFPDHPVGWVVDARVAMRRSDWASAAALWEACLARFAARAAPGWYEQFGRCLLTLSHHEKAAQAFGALRDRWPEDPRGWAGLAETAMASRAIPAALAAYEACFARFGEAAPLAWYRGLVQCAALSARFDLARRWRAAAIARWPASLLEAGSGASERQMRDARAVALWHIASRLREDPADALAQIEALPAVLRDSEDVGVLRRSAIALRPAAGVVGEPAGQDGMVHVRRHAGATDRVLLLFAGAGAESVWAALDALEPLLARFPCHLVFLREARAGFYLNGIARVGTGFDGFAAGLRRLAQELGATRLYACGESSGGYAALRYGLELGAEAVLAFSPQTGPDASAMDRAYLAAIRAEQPGLALDLPPLFQAAARPPRAVLCFAEGHQADCAEAERLGGLPSVRLMPLPGLATHSVVRAVIARGLFGPLVAEMLGEPWAEDPAP